MGDGIQKALDVGLERARQAEAFYKGWAQRTDDPAARDVFGEIGAAKHGQQQVLEHITPADVAGVSSGGAPFESAKLGFTRRPAQETLGAAVAAGLACEEASERLYGQLAGLGGEASALFRALASEARAHAARLRGLCAASSELPAKPASGERGK